MNNEQKTERPTQETENAESESAVSLRHGLGNDAVIKKDVLNVTQKAINNLRFLVLNGTTEIPKQKCQELINELETYLNDVSKWLLENQSPTIATV